MTDVNHYRRIGEILFDEGLITRSQLRSALQEQLVSRYNRRLGEILLRKNLITEQQLDEALTLQLSGIESMVLTLA
ncbi:MAG: hypothetical protein LBC65_05470 [Oscillospiraceae bacterium]|jgi:hypothetical protein|nr:hypothetical protein [Oscillospiraceae bacterium]